MKPPKNLVSFLATHPLNTTADLKAFWLLTIAERDKHPEYQRDIARFAFSATLNRLLHHYDQLKATHFELGALAAPGTPETNEPLSEYDERLWRRFESLVKKVRVKLSATKL